MFEDLRASRAPPDPRTECRSSTGTRANRKTQVPSVDLPAFSHVQHRTRVPSVDFLVLRAPPDSRTVKGLSHISLCWKMPTVLLGRCDGVASWSHHPRAY